MLIYERSRRKLRDFELQEIKSRRKANDGHRMSETVSGKMRRFMEREGGVKTWENKNKT